MQAALLSALDTSRWELWAVPVAGVLSAGLLVWVGRLLLGSRTTPLAEAAEEEEPGDGSQRLRRDRRGGNRRAGNQIVVAITNATASIPPVSGHVINRSRGGLRLAVSEPVATTGVILSVRPRTAPANTPWVQIEVRSCRQRGSSWELHCRFLKSPPEDVLVLFG